MRTLVQILIYVFCFGFMSCYFPLNIIEQPKIRNKVEITSVLFKDNVFILSLNLQKYRYKISPSSAYTSEKTKKQYKIKKSFIFKIPLIILNDKKQNITYEICFNQNNILPGNNKDIYFNIYKKNNGYILNSIGKIEITKKITTNGSISFSQNNNYILINDNNKNHLIDTDGFSYVSTDIYSSPENEIYFDKLPTDDGKYIFVVTNYNILKIYSTDTGTLINSYPLRSRSYIHFGQVSDNKIQALLLSDKYYFLDQSVSDTFISQIPKEFAFYSKHNVDIGRSTIYFFRLSKLLIDNDQAELEIIAWNYIKKQLHQHRLTLTLKPSFYEDFPNDNG